MALSIADVGYLGVIELLISCSSKQFFSLLISLLALSNLF